MPPRFLLFLPVMLAAKFLILHASAQVWEALPQITAQSRARGVEGGEGCQWPQALAVDATGQRVLLGTDVGGIYRSEDSGNSWQPSNTNFDPRGVSAFAFDPINSSRVLLIAGNSLECPFHGIWLSIDGAVSWKNTQPYDNLGYRDFREQVAFDRATADPDGKLTRVAYWSAAKTKTRGPGFFKTEDGGTTWTELPGIGEKLGAAIVKVHPTKGIVYAGNKTGLFVSRDGGKTFSLSFDQSVTGLDVVPAAPDRVFISTANDIRISDDAGSSFQIVAATQFPPTANSGVKRLRVSPADPQRMILESDEGSYNLQRYITWDGGVTWDKVRFNVKESFIPNNNRQMVVAWHPTDPNVLWSVGGDFITKSTDGGKTLAWSNSGYTGLMVGHSFNFNATQPDLVFVPSQDYDGSISDDAGRTWKYTGVSGEGWGGFTYGGYGFNLHYVVGGSRKGWGGKSELRINDSGKVLKSGIELQGPAIGAGDPRDANMAFVHNHRTTDAGKTWTPMVGCSAVFTFDAANLELLYGANQAFVVVSRDHGETWNPVFKVPTDVRDIAVDGIHHVIYVAGNNERLYRWTTDATVEDITQRLPADQFGKRGACSVAVDPVDSSLVYVVHSGNTYATDVAVARSSDAGTTWISLTRSQRLGTGLDGPDGAREGLWVRVHANNRYAYIATSCFGLWRIAAPASGAPIPATDSANPSP